MTPMSMYIYITVKSLSYIQCSKTIVKQFTSTCLGANAMHI